MGSSLMQRNKVVARRKGLIAGATVGASALAIVASPVIGVLGLAGAAYFTWDWFSFRMKNGMRF